MTKKRKLNRIQVHAKTILSDQMFKGEQTRESFVNEVDARFQKECKDNGEIYARTVKKEVEVDAVRHLASQVLGSVLQSSTKMILSCLVDGVPMSEDELWHCWLEVKTDSGTIIIRAAQADMMMIVAKIESVRKNTEKQVAALKRWTDAEKTLSPYLKQGMLVGDAIRQLGLVFSEGSETG